MSRSAQDHTEDIYYDTEYVEAYKGCTLNSKHDGKENRMYHTHDHNSHEITVMYQEVHCFVDQAVFLHSLPCFANNPSVCLVHSILHHYFFSDHLINFQNSLQNILNITYPMTPMIGAIHNGLCISHRTGSAMTDTTAIHFRA